MLNLSIRNEIWFMFFCCQFFYSGLFKKAHYKLWLPILKQACFFASLKYSNRGSLLPWLTPPNTNFLGLFDWRKF